MSPATPGVKSFKINVNELKRLKYDTESDELLSPY